MNPQRKKLKDGSYSAGIEEWRDIPNYEGIYQASSLGNIQRLAGSPKCKTTRLLKLNPRTNGYVFVSLSLNAEIYEIDAHRLIALTFIGPANGLWVNHKNGIKTDNRIENLEYTTPGQNTQHAYDNGLNRGPVGELNGMAKLTAEDVWMIRMCAAHDDNYMSREEIAAIYGVSRTTITEVINSNSWKEVTI